MIEVNAGVEDRDARTIPAEARLVRADLPALPVSEHTLDAVGQGFRQLDPLIGLHRYDLRFVRKGRRSHRRALELETIDGVLEHVSDMAPDGTGQAWGIGRWIEPSSRRTIHELRASAPAPGLGSDLPPAAAAGAMMETSSATAARTTTNDRRRLRRMRTSQPAGGSAGAASGPVAAKAALPPVVRAPFSRLLSRMGRGTDRLMLSARAPDSDLGTPPACTRYDDR